MWLRLSVPRTSACGLEALTIMFMLRCSRANGVHVEAGGEAEGLVVEVDQDEGLEFAKFGWQRGYAAFSVGLSDRAALVR